MKPWWKLWSNLQDPNLITHTPHFCFSCNAKFLWKRIPSYVKLEHAELGKIWEVGQALWLRDTPNFFATIDSNTWSDEIKPLIDAIKGLFGNQSLLPLGLKQFSINAVLGKQIENPINFRKKGLWNVSKLLHFDEYLFKLPRSNLIKHFTSILSTFVFDFTHFINYLNFFMFLISSGSESHRHLGGPVLHEHLHARVHSERWSVRERGDRVGPQSAGMEIWRTC